jgi:hypothetical protein
MNPQDLQAFGYKASRDAQGVLTIHAVPIFVACSRGEMTFDDAWIAQAVAKAKQAEAEGYLPPLHVRHHEDGPSLTEQVRAAGYFRITGTGPITFKGTSRVAVFADLVITDPMVREDVLAKRLPYRSVEIFDVTAPAIDSLALLDHEAPYLELPMLMVADVDEAPGARPNTNPTLGFANATFANPWRAPRAQRQEPVLAFFHRGRSAHVITEDQMANKTTAEDEAKKGAKLAADAKDAAKCAADGQPEKKPEDKKGDKKPDEKMAEGGTDVGAIVKAIKSGSISVADMDAIMAAIKEQEAGKETPEADGAAKTAAPASAPGEAMTKGQPDEAFARLAGENLALKARLDERDAADQRRDDVAAALKRLEGRPLGSDLEGKLLAFHKEHGAKSFKDHVDAIAQTFGALPRSNSAAADYLAQSERVSEAVMAFQKDGSAAMERAAAFSREWAELRRHNCARVDEKTYVAINMARIAAASRN